MTSPQPLVSVVIPARNAGRFVAEAVTSALEQTHRNVEVLVADDGSTDDTASVLRRITDERLVVLTGPASGCARARNRAVAAASGSFVAFLDADDVWYPNKLEMQLPCFTDQAVVCVGSLFRYRLGSRVLGALGCVPSEEELRRVREARFMPVQVSSLVVRRSTLLEVGVFDETVARVEDMELLSRLTRAGVLMVVDEVLGEYRVHGGGVSRADPLEQLRWGRFIGERFARRDAGGDLTYEEFVETEKHRSARDLRRDRAASIYTTASITFATDAPARAMAQMLHALLVDPRYVVAKARSQRVWRLRGSARPGL